MKRTKYLLKVVVSLFIMFNIVVNNIMPVKAVDVTNATTIGLNSGWVEVKTSEKQLTQYHKIVLTTPGFLNIEIRPQYEVECSFVNENFTKTYFRKVYEKNYTPSICYSQFSAVNSYLEAGTYYYCVKGVSSYGKYSIEANFEPANNNELEPNQTFTQAMKLTEGAITGFISEDDDVDIYSIDIAENQTFVLMPMDYNEKVFSDLTNVSIYDSNFNKIYEPYGLYSPVYFDWTEGTYYIQISENVEGPQGAYEFEYAIIDNSLDKVQYTYFDDKYQSMYVNSSLLIKPVVLPATVSNKSFIWKSSNTKVATVSEDGVLTGKKPGAVVITATSADNPDYTLTYDLTVQSIHLTFEKYNVSLKVGKKYTLKPKLLIGESQIITYTSMNSQIVTVNKNGVVTAKKAGVAKIMAQANGLTRYITFKVSK